MGHTNSTANYNLPQFIGTDKPTWLGDVNGAMAAIDAAIAGVASDATGAASVAENAATVAAAATTTANAASTTATSAATEAASATTTANNAATTANNAQSTAVSAYNKAITVGDITELTTTDKTSAVAAINEVNAAVGDLTDLDTTVKTSVVAAINEVVAELPTGGSVSVTADGVKTWSDILTELYSNADPTKLSINSYISAAGIYLKPVNASIFAGAYCDNTNTIVVSVNLTTHTRYASVNASTPTDESTYPVASGAIITLYY